MNAALFCQFIFYKCVDHAVACDLHFALEGGRCYEDAGMRLAYVVSVEQGR